MQLLSDELLRWYINFFGKKRRSNEYDIIYQRGEQKNFVKTSYQFNLFDGEFIYFVNQKKQKTTPHNSPI